MNAVQTFFDDYRRVFASFDLDSLVTRFTFPLHIVSATDEGAVSSVFAGEEDWRPVVDGLLGAYRALGVVDGEPLELDIAELTPRVASARVRWRLVRADASAIYEFTAVYTVAEVDGVFRIAALAHDELPKLGTAMAAAQGS